ncbi:MAG TPA: family 10 glycosylhydrolase [Acholeplasma sp.]|nr:family 10 glycosylhydrolase [Acholeplasma sp.]
MKKFRLLVLTILLSFVLIAVGNLSAQGEPPTPVHTITGEYDAVNDVYTSTIEIELGFTGSVSGVSIVYQLFQGIPPSSWTTYNEPILIQRKGNYRLRYRSLKAGVYGAEQAINIRVDIDVVETYPHVIRNNEILKHKDTGLPIELPIYTERTKEIRGVWVSTVANIDLNQWVDDQQYKNEIISILNRVQSLNMNTIFFQIRSMNDAMYPSELAPYSRFIKGAQGEGLDWDILRFTIDEAHKRGLELHAWLNPYRIANMPAETTHAEMLATLHADNFAKKNPHLVLKQTNAPSGGTATFILDPGRPEVRQYLSDVIEEVLTNYPDVDGIHFDDYFYVTTTEDAQTFINYNPTNISTLADWRRNNVDMMIKNVHDIVEDFNITNGKKVKFGVSPGGIWANKSTHPDGSNSTGWQSYVSLFADTRKWVKEEWLDYILPQLYWDFGATSSAFEVLVDWWVDVVSDVNVDLLVGLGFYRYTDNTPWTNEDIFVEQLRYISQYAEVAGHVTFSFRTFNRAIPQIVSTIERLENYYWTKPVDFTWASDVEVLPLDNDEILAVKQEIRDLITQVNNYITSNEVQSDEGLEPDDLILGKKYASAAALAAINAAIEEAEGVVDNRFRMSVFVEEKVILQNAFNAFKDAVYQGSFDPNRDQAVSILQGAVNQLRTRRNLIQDSEGKQASELPKGQYFAPKTVLTAVDNIIAAAETIIADETSVSPDINAVYYELKDVETTLLNSYFQGQQDPQIVVTFVYGEDRTETVTLEEAGPVAKPANPTKEGYTFTGWYLGDNLYDFNTVVTASITLNAVFEEEDISVVTDNLEVALAEFKKRVDKVKASENTNPEELRKGYQYVTPEKKAELNELINEAQALLDNENSSREEIVAMLTNLNAVDEGLDNHIVVGEKESNYRQIAIIVGSIILGVSLVGGLTILVLVKKRK